MSGRVPGLCAAAGGCAADPGERGRRRDLPRARTGPGAAALAIATLATLVSSCWLAGRALATDRAPADAPAAAEPRPGAALLYFFSPDWRPPDLGKLTVAVEDALASGGVSVSFQAFTRYEDFERQVHAHPPVFLIAPQWVDGAEGSGLGLRLTVIARPQRHGKSTYRKALMTRSNIDSIDDLARGSVAATLYSMGAGSPATVLDAFHLAADSAKVVPVPKDVDALLALSFGQVDAALVTSEQYELLARTNPPEAERLRVLAFSPEVRLPPVFACGDVDPALSGRLRDLLVRLPEISEGSNVLELLGFDGFVADVPATTGAEAAVQAATDDPPPAAAPPVAKNAPPAKKRAADSRSAKKPGATKARPPAPLPRH